MERHASRVCIDNDNEQNQSPAAEVNTGYEGRNRKRMDGRSGWANRKMAEHSWVGWANSGDRAELGRVGGSLKSFSDAHEGRWQAKDYLHSSIGYPPLHRVQMRGHFFFWSGMFDKFLGLQFNLPTCLCSFSLPQKMNRVACLLVPGNALSISLCWVGDTRWWKSPPRDTIILHPEDEEKTACELESLKAEDILKNQLYTAVGAGKWGTE